MSLKILQCGHDELLLMTRELILEQDGFRVSSATDPIRAVDSLAPHQIGLLLLCHTLSDHELEHILAAVRALPDPPKVLTLLASTFSSFAPNATNEIFTSPEGPGTLLAAVHGLLDDGTPQAHPPGHGATHAETHRHRQMV